VNPDAPFSEFVEYPDLTVAQKDVLRAIDLALFGVQTIEAKLRFVIAFVFPDQADATLQELHSRSAAHAKATLGRLIRKLRETTDVSTRFEEQLQTFLEMRNRFVHGLLLERGHNLGSDEGIQAVQSFIQSLESHAWQISAVLMGYIVLFSKAFGIHDHIGQRDSIYMRNLHKYFSPEIRLPKRDSP